VNNTISNAIISTLGGERRGGRGREISLHFHPIWEAGAIDEWRHIMVVVVLTYKLSVVP